MRKTHIIRAVVLCAACVIWASATPTAQAITLNLSSADDLSNVTLGDTVTVDVSLADLDTANSQELATLISSVLFNSGHFATPFNTANGPIVPLAADFFVFNGPGLADGTFLQLLGDPISINGVFYSFDVTASALGSGSFALDANALTAEDSNFQLLTVNAGNPLTYNIVDSQGPNTNPVPEPATAALSLLAAGALLIGRRRTHR